MSCSECNARLPKEAEACPECGYPVVPRRSILQEDHPDGTLGSIREYRIVQVFGAVVVGVGTAAWVADSPLAATVAITVGLGTYMVGLLGAWWNTGD